MHLITLIQMLILLFTVCFSWWRGCIYSLMLCLLLTGVGLESPKEGLTEVFSFSSAIHDIFKQRDLKIATSSFFLSSDRNACQGSCTRFQGSDCAELPWDLLPHPPSSVSWFKLSPELCWACACLQPWEDSALVCCYWDG